MSFNKALPQTPDHVDVIAITFMTQRDPADSTGNTITPVSGEFRIGVMDAAGKLLCWQQGQAIPNMTTAQITQINAFFAAVRTQATNQIILGQ